MASFEDAIDLFEAPDVVALDAQLKSLRLVEQTCPACQRKSSALAQFYECCSTYACASCGASSACPSCGSGKLSLSQRLAAAMYDVALDHATGRKGAARDDAKAASMLEKAAKEGSVCAKRDWGRCLVEGLHGVAPDAAAGATWLVEAADAGEAEAMALLGEYGIYARSPTTREPLAGYAADPAAGLAWLKRGAAAGSGRAARLLAELAGGRDDDAGAEPGG